MSQRRLEHLLRLLPVWLSERTGVSSKDIVKVLEAQKLFWRRYVESFWGEEP